MTFWQSSGPPWASLTSEMPAPTGTPSGAGVIGPGMAGTAVTGAGVTRPGMTGAAVTGPVITLWALGCRGQDRRRRIAGRFLGDKQPRPATCPNDRPHQDQCEPNAFCSHRPYPPFTRRKSASADQAWRTLPLKPPLPELTAIPFVTNRPIVGATLEQSGRNHPYLT